MQMIFLPLYPQNHAGPREERSSGRRWPRPDALPLHHLRGKAEGPSQGEANVPHPKIEARFSFINSFSACIALISQLTSWHRHDPAELAPRGLERQDKWLLTAQLKIVTHPICHHCGNCVRIFLSFPALRPEKVMLVPTQRRGLPGGGHRVHRGGQAGCQGEGRKENVQKRPSTTGRNREVKTEASSL